MKQTLCDRCGRITHCANYPVLCVLKERPAVAGMSNPQLPEGTRPFDLCDPCIDALKAWLKGDK